MSGYWRGCEAAAVAHPLDSSHLTATYLFWQDQDKVLFTGCLPRQAVEGVGHASSTSVHGLRPQGVRGFECAFGLHILNGQDAGADPHFDVVSIQVNDSGKLTVKLHQLNLEKIRNRDD